MIFLNRHEYCLLYLRLPPQLKRRMKYFCIIFVLPLLITAGTLHALTIVHMEAQLDVTTTDIYFELYDDVAPNNVNNFLGYVTRGDFDNSFFHRKVQYSDGSPFVVQGGGFTYVPQFDPDARFFAVGGATTLMAFADPVTGELGLRQINEPYVVDANNDDVPDEDPPGSGNLIVRTNNGLNRIPIDTSVLPVLSEARLSNVRGTIAMALTGAGADSATNQWFVNLNDNISLDPGYQNFTVFGRVLGDGINFFDSVNNLATYPMASVVNQEFVDLPVVNYQPYSLILGENLVRVNSVSEVLKIDITDHDFGFNGIGQTAPPLLITLTVSAQWKSDLVISKIGDIELLDLPFGVTSNCTDAPISPGSNCAITVTFAPTTADNFNDVLDIAFNGLGIPNLSINIAGTSRTLPRVSSSAGTNLDFQYIYPGNSEVQRIAVTNLGQQTLTFTDVVIDTVENFTLTHNCVALQYKESCNVDVTFSTPNEGLKTALLTLVTNAPESPFTISLRGTGSLTIVPDIDAVDIHDFGDLLSGREASGEITLTNRGSSVLKKLDSSLVGNGASDFTLSSNCTVVLAVGKSCTLTVGFVPTTTGSKVATLRITSDDPDEAVFDISLVGTSSSDQDNIPDAEENAAPNNGDGDADTVKDRQQSNVVSLRTANNQYITLTTTSLLSFIDTEIVDNPSPGDMPAVAKLDNGLLRFTLGPISTAASYKIGMILPVEQRVSTLYHYGPTPDNPVPHWYEFMFDAETGTGAQIFNNVTMTSPNGRPMQRNIIQIWYADGRRGDDDLTVNGSITSTGGVSTALLDTAASSSFNACFTTVIFILLFVLRCVINPRKYAL